MFKLQEEFDNESVRCVNCGSIIYLDECIMYNELVLCNNECKKEYEYLISIGEISKIII